MTAYPTIAQSKTVRIGANIRLSLCACLMAGLALPSSGHGRPHPYNATRHKSSGTSPSAEVDRANASARVQPVVSAIASAEQVYAFTPGALYQVYTSVGKVTDIALQDGEGLVGTGPVAAGDTTRWIIGSTESGSGDHRQMHILVKPSLPGLATNLVINTDRRTYHIEVQALATTYVASVSWRYPQDELVAIARATEPPKVQTTTIVGNIDPTRLNFRYRLTGDTVPWKPVRCFDDGQHVYIEMPQGSAGADLPPLFLIADDGKAELVNYRVRSPYVIVDRLFGVAELRLGDAHRQKVVRILRVAGDPT